MYFSMSTLRSTKLVYVLQHEYTEAYEACLCVLHHEYTEAYKACLCVLHHEYTEAGLSFHGLKNKDQAVAEVLCLATKEADLVVHLVIFSRHESGSAEYTAYDYYYRYKCQCWSSDERSWMKILLTGQWMRRISSLSI